MRDSLYTDIDFLLLEIYSDIKLNTYQKKDAEKIIEDIILLYSEPKIKRKSWWFLPTSKEKTRVLR